MIADFSHCKACTVDQYCAKKFRCQFHFADADLLLLGRKLNPVELVSCDDVEEDVKD